MYRHGHGVPRDYRQAAYWTRKAADQGYVMVQLSLGWDYEHGEGVPQDLQQARYWYQKAAVQGNADAQTHLNNLNQRLSGQGGQLRTQWEVSKDFNNNKS